MRNNPTNVNKLTFNEFRNILDNRKREHGITNKIFDDGNVWENYIIKRFVPITYKKQLE